MSRPMKDSGIAWVGQIPSDWDIHRVKYHFQHDKHVVGIHSSKYERLALTMQGVIKRSKEDNEGLQPEDFASYQILRQNELVFKLIDLQNISTSRVGLSPYEGLVSPAYIILHASSASCPKYAYYFFLFMWLDAIFNSLGDAGVRSSLNAGDLLNLPIIVPSLPEQRKIVEYLDKKCADVEGLSNNIQKQIEALEQYKRAVITETVTKGFHPSVPMKDSGIPWIGKIPQHWSTLPLRYWMLSRQSGAWGENEQQNQDDHPCVRVADFDYDTYQLKDNTPTTLRNYTQQTVNLLALKKNDILIEKSGGGEKTPVGRSIIIRKDFDSPILFANFVERIRIKPMYCVMYVEYALVAFYKQGLSTFYFQQTTGIQNLNITKMFRMESIPCPSLHEQQAIADYLDKKCAKIDGIIHAKQQQLEELEQYKKAIIFEYVTGKKQVPEA